MFDQDNLSPARAAGEAGVSEVTIRRAIRAGRLPARRLPGNRLAISRADLEVFLRGKPVVVVPAGRPAGG